jgi:undecaprenyl-diphosphatase
MTELLQFDQEIFHTINSGWQNAFFDWLMPIIRNKLVWIPLYVFLASFILINFKKGWFMLFVVFVCVGSTDLLSSQLLKQTVQRERPCKVEALKTETHLLVACGSGYSFPSSHAANHFSLATILILLFGSHFRWIKIPLLIWAASIAFAQIYVGVHYPLDALAGASLGILTATTFWWVFKKPKPQLLVI